MNFVSLLDPMHRPPRKLIVVTGPPRAGTTVVGEVLGFASRAATIHEPMNVDTGDRAITKQFEVPGTDGISEADFDGLVDRLLHRRLQLKSGAFPGEPAWRRSIKAMTGGRTMISQRRALMAGRIDTLIWKDPFATFATDAIARRVPSSTNVLCYRPALATAASFKRMKWRFDHRPLARRLGIEGLDTLIPAGIDPCSPALGGAILWKLAYEQALEAARVTGPQRPVLFDIDDAIADPVAAYCALYRRCGLSFSETVHKKVGARYRQDGAAPELDSGTAHVRNRDVANINNYWQSVLDVEEIALIRDFCDPLEHRIAAHLKT